jgi:hypothetical protein
MLKFRVNGKNIKNIIDIKIDWIIDNQFYSVVCRYDRVEISNKNKWVEILCNKEEINKLIMRFSLVDNRL